MRDVERLTGRIVICAPATFPSFFADDVLGTCELCGQAVRFRPHVPTPHALVCLTCFFVRAEPGETCEILGAAVDEYDALAQRGRP
jgi:hypothetical protein